MITIKLQLEEETFERAQRLAEVRRNSLETLVAEIIERLALIDMQADPLLGMFADEPEIMDQVVESVMIARELHPLRPMLDE